jgi:hypothetical protein
MATLLCPERLQLMPLILRDEMLLQGEKAFHDHNQLQDLEAGQREDSVEALVATVQVVLEVLFQRRTRKNLHHGVSLAFVL